MTARKQVVLECMHVRFFSYAPPRLGERIYCFDCDRMQAVIGAPSDYRAVCDDCTDLYITRKSPESLRKRVVQHLVRCPTHTVSVWQIGLPPVYKVQRNADAVLDGFDAPDVLPLSAMGS